MSGYAGLHLGWEGDFGKVKITHVRLVLPPTHIFCMQPWYALCPRCATAGMPCVLAALLLVCPVSSLRYCW